MDTLKQLKDAVLLSVNAPEMVKTIDAASILERNTTQAGTVIDTIPYMRAYATTYALMYSYNRTGSNDDSTYYNKKFIEFSSYGGDCANFASQCMWAGFYGSNDTDSITNGRLPMDSKGSINWYCQSNSIRNGNWCYANMLCDYPEAVANAGSGESGIIADVYKRVSGGQMSIPNIGSNLNGAVFCVTTSTTNGHAIVINNASSNSLNNIYFCAHTQAVNNMPLSASVGYALSKIDTIIVPQSFRVVSNCSGHVYSSVANGHDSICNNCGYSRLRLSYSWATGTVGQSKILTSTVSSFNNCYKISAVVKNSLGTVVHTIPTVNNTTSITGNYTFTAAGIYDVEVTVYDTSSTTTPQKFTYSIKIS